MGILLIETLKTSFLCVFMRFLMFFSQYLLKGSLKGSLFRVNGAFFATA